LRKKKERAKGPDKRQTTAFANTVKTGEWEHHQDRGKEKVKKVQKKKKLTRVGSHITETIPRPGHVFSTNKKKKKKQKKRRKPTPGPKKPKRGGLPTQKKQKNTKKNNPKKPKKNKHPWGPKVMGGGRGHGPSQEGGHCQRGGGAGGRGSTP